MVMMWEEIISQPEVLESCVLYNREAITKIVNLLKDRDIEGVVIAARGTSDHAGVYAKYVIECTLGLPVSLAAPSVFTIYKKKMKLKNFLVIGISQSGHAADVIEVVKAANSCGALSIAITNDEGSPLASEAGFHLYCNAGQEKSVAATKTFTAEMMIIARLVAQWSGDKELTMELDAIADNIRKVIGEGNNIAAKVSRYRFMNECFVLARGLNYSIALETALKIQETCYVRARAYAASDFHHGPFAMIEKDMPVIMYAPNGPALHDMVEMAKKLKQSGAELLVVSNNNAMLKAGAVSFKIPDTDFDIISPFYNIVFAQMFACKLSLSKGLNPDSPRGLKKVTITR